MEHSAVERHHTILLVEDSEADSELIRLAFAESSLSCTIAVTRDGAQALDYLYRRAPYTQAFAPELILLDLNMPKMDGRQFLAMVKEDARLKSIPVILLSSSQARHDIQECYQLCANCYIVKPDDFKGFSRMVAQIERFLAAHDSPGDYCKMQS